MSQGEYSICTNCVMDTTDPNITFDERGWCGYCRNYYENIQPNWHPNDEGERILAPLIDKIKRDGKGRDHDCLIGISGGVDSSYVACLAKEKFGLNPLLFTVDTGWNTPEAIYNVQRIVDGLGLDVHREVVDWEEMKDLQVAYFKSQVAAQDTPQDHAIFAALYNFAAKFGIKYILTGANYSTECVREPLEWHYHASDLVQLKDIHKKFGKKELKRFPTCNILRYRIYYKYIKGVTVVKPLNYTPFIKNDIIKLLQERFGWQAYSNKHFECIFTRFIEGYWLPTKFGFDKRKAHWSSLILTKQLDRNVALEKLKQPPYDEKLAIEDMEYVANKLEISLEELKQLMQGENKSYKDYKSQSGLMNFATNILRLLGIQKTIIR